MSQYVARCVLRNESWIARVVGDVGGGACARGPIPLSGDLKNILSSPKKCSLYLITKIIVDSMSSTPNKRAFHLYQRIV